MEFRRSGNLPFLIPAVLVLFLMISCDRSDDVVLTVEGKGIRLEFNERLHSRVVSTLDHKEVVLGRFTPSEFITIAGQKMTDFRMTHHSSEWVEDDIGAGTRSSIMADAPSLRKEIVVTAYDDFPTLLSMKVTYVNTGDEELSYEGWTSNHYAISVASGKREAEAFWSYQSGSYEDRHDWVLPLSKGFEQQNYLGMNASDYGGGTPIIDVWRPDVGLAIGLLNTRPKLVSLPVSMSNNREASMAVAFEDSEVLEPGDSLTTFLTFVAVHRGDYFETLSVYHRIMVKQGIEFQPAPETAYEPIWCAWGYRRNFTMDQIYGTLPMVKDLGYKWAVLDDGWQTAEGDWYLVEDKFPNGDASMQQLVDKLHAEGLKAKLWWVPLAVDPGTDLIREHPDYLLLNEDGSTQDISWWDAYYLCPASEEVVSYTKDLVLKMIRDWGFDGLKIDGQHLNGVPPCHNDAHHHPYPEESVEKLPDFYRMIYELVLGIKPQAVVEICPCGTAYNFYYLPYINQAVSSDPLNSWQIRLKGKTLKALSGSKIAYYGDHVELSDNGTDFASTVGIGGVIGTKFTWPVGVAERPSSDLTPEKVEDWRKWTRIYTDKMLSTGMYRGELYDIGYDRPETHVVQKEGHLYYALYAEEWDGVVELRGLDHQTYSLVDYENDQVIGEVSGPVGQLAVSFDHHLLIEAIPE